ncbi:hypothetical protein BDV98DRAFT_560282 [Pterulicium gracile]|uniref:Uncharacterized protein n=1 Tax=Pterulicium gracile TaxID=1884261 RepID=A0A5C3QW75_9AGAR|nr:hypothetical protein BDV98DRAFT_560282 [Pterula gracilis]
MRLDTTLLPSTSSHHPTALTTSVSSLFASVSCQCRHSPRAAQLMCGREVVGDWYRPCRHFIKAYDTSNTSDCMSERCGLSSAHKHTARLCGCPLVEHEIQKIQNMFRFPCDSCKQAEWDRRAGSQVQERW